MRWLALAVAVGVGACGEEAPTPRHRELAGSIARVGPEVVAPATVARIAAAQGIDREEARERAVTSALLAAAAREDLHVSTVRHAENRALAWALLGELWADAQRAPISDLELAEATAGRWTAVDRPRSHRTLHAVVRTDQGDRASAQALAERIREAVVDVAARARDEAPPVLEVEALLTGAAEARYDPAQEPFEAAAKAVAAGDPRLVVELLPPVARDGTIVAVGMPPENRRFDADFAAGVFQLEQRGDLSPIVESAFGFHVILLLGVIDEHRLSAAERRRFLTPDILRVRGLRAQRALLERLAAERTVEVVRNHAAILEQALAGHGPDDTGVTP